MLTDIARLGDEYGVPVTDVTMIALNAYGLSNKDDVGRSRCVVSLESSANREFRSIFVTDRAQSPFRFDGDRLLADEVEIGKISGVEHDDARLAYFRNAGKVVTMNTNARSHCTGCVFCPNTGSDASDPKIDVNSDELRRWLNIFSAEHGLGDLALLDQVNVSTSCFGEEAAAISHMSLLKQALTESNFKGRLGILSSVIRSAKGLSEVVDACESFALFLTLECVTRRSLWLKDSKASLSATEGINVLERARLAGADTGVTLVVGLDPFAELIAWLERAVNFFTDFPNLQVYQVHSAFMQGASVMGAEPLRFLLEARLAMEAVFASRPELRPEHWQNYRPFWYTVYGGRDL